ncbi:hypothetical protein GWK08_16795 [Leptobacterium flavescens]|uniref:Uncharacterized protein n=1 Tax=Leptobacterium flavescens TaxID=472055 RepID=A0A6P0UPM1_9FLAO|nr:hypothetical protein [Leptobacterium flavescens]NER15115.1 hypothetical protein [Leptobacterium flavescens]
MNFVDFVEFVSKEFQRSDSEFKNLGSNLAEHDGLHYGDGQYFRLKDNVITVDLVRNEGHADLFDDQWDFWMALKSESDIINQKVKDFLAQSDFGKRIVYEITSELD